MSSDTPFGMPELPSDWTWKILDELSERVSVGHVGETSSVFCGEEGVIFLRSQNVRPGKVEFDEVKYVTKEFHQKSKKSHLKAGDILIVRVGQNRGDCAVVPDGFGELNCANIVFSRLKNKKYSEFLGYFFNSSFGRASLLAVSTGSAQGVLNTKSIAKVLVPVPPEDIAEQIGKVLKVFDNKITLNNQINQTFEAMAQTIFKNWFVDFEPVKAKIAAIEAGEDAESVNRAAMRAISGKSDAGLDKMQAEWPEEYTQLKGTAELFPVAMWDSELGEVPKDWKVVDLKKMSKTISKGTTPSKTQIADAEGAPSISFIKVKDIADDGQINRAGLELIHESIHKGALKRSILSENDLLFSIAGTIGRVSIVEDDLQDSNINQAIAFIRLNDKEHLSLVLEHLKSKRIQSSAIASIVQGVQANVSLANVGSFQIIIPKDSILTAWNKVALSLHNEKLRRQKQNRLLSKLRDTLLPKLVSGDAVIDFNETIEADV